MDRPRVRLFHRSAIPWFPLPLRLIVVVAISSPHWLVGLFSAGTFGQPWPDGSDEPLVYQSRKLSKGRFGPDGDLFTLSAGAHEIVRRDPATGATKMRYHMDVEGNANTLEGNKEPLAGSTGARHLLFSLRESRSSSEPTAVSAAILAVSPSRIAATLPRATAGTDLFITDWSLIRRK